MILGPVAPFSQSMSPWRATATHFGSKIVVFGPPQNANICYRTPKISIIRLCMYCKQRIMYCKYKYMPQRYRLYVSKIQIICFKDANSILQIHSSAYRISMSQIHTLYMSEIEICVCYIHRNCISVLYIHRICII